MLTKSQQKDIIEKIVNSKEFSGSKIYRNFLTYLVDSTNQGKELKETTIALEVFNKDANFNPAENTIVRSHIYTLRKKLEHYYYNEGKKDEYRLLIPKGHYEAIFIESGSDGIQKNFSLFKNILHLQIPLVYFLGCFVMLLLIYVLFIKSQFNQHQIIDKNDPIWKDYLQSSLPILTVVGDHFLFNEYSEKYKRTIGVRHVEVNSPADLEKFQNQFPNTIRKASEEPYFPYHSVWTIPDILSILSSARQKTILRKASSISPQILDEYNIIFIGSIKTLYNLEYTLAKSHLQFDITPQRVIYNNPESDTLHVFNTNSHSFGQSEDLVVAVKLPGPVNNSILIIASYHSLGAPEITNYLTSSNSLNELEQLFIDKYNYVPQYFEILFRVTGIDKTAYNTKILIMNEIENK